MAQRPKTQFSPLSSSPVLQRQSSIPQFQQNLQLRNLRLGGAFNSDEFHNSSAGRHSARISALGDDIIARRGGR